MEVPQAHPDRNASLKTPNSGANRRKSPCILKLTRKFAKRMPLRLRWVNTMLGNVKRSIDGTYHAIDAKHVPRYLAAFSYRFNRRYQLADLVPRLVYASANTPPMPCRLLKLDESCV